MLGRNPYPRPGILAAAEITGLVLGVIVVAYILANLPPVDSDRCPVSGDPFPIYILYVTERTPTDLEVDVNATSSDGVPLSVFTAVISLDGRSVGALSPLTDGASNGSLGFRDATGPGNLSKGDRFTVSPLASGSYRLDLIVERCSGHIFGRATWIA